MSREWTTIEALIERACDPILISADWGLNMQICDVLQAKSSARCIPQAMATIKNHILKPDRDSNMRALELLEACVKNVVGVWPIVGSKDYLLTLKKKASQRDLDLAVREKVLELIVTWATAFKNRPDLHFGPIYTSMLKEGVSFPPPTDVQAFNIPKPKLDARKHPAYSGQQTNSKLDVELIRNNVGLLQEVLSFINPEQEDVSTNVIVAELLEPLKEAQSSIMAALSSGRQTESAINVLIQLNEEILTLQETYASLLQKRTSPPKAKAPPSTTKEPTTRSRDDVPIPTLPPPKSLAAGGKLEGAPMPSKKIEVDEFDLIARRTSKTASGLPVVSVPPKATPMPLPSFVPEFGVDPSPSVTTSLTNNFDPFATPTPASAFPPSSFTLSPTTSVWSSIPQPARPLPTMSPAPLLGTAPIPTAISLPMLPPSFLPAQPFDPWTSYPSPAPAPVVDNTAFNPFALPLPSHSATQPISTTRGETKPQLEPEKEPASNNLLFF